MPKYVLSQSARSRRLTWRYVLLLGGLLLLIALLQVSFFARFQILGVTPDLMIVTVLCIAVFGGEHMGACVGLASGFLIDSLGSTGIVLLPLFYFLLGYIVGHFVGRFPARGYVTYLYYLGVTLLYRMAITTVYTAITYTSLHPGPLLVHILLPEALVTAIAGLGLYFPIKLFCAFLGKR